MGNYSVAYHVPRGTLILHHQGYLFNHKILHLKVFATPVNPHWKSDSFVTGQPPRQAHMMSQLKRIVEREECDLAARSSGFLNHHLSNQNILVRKPLMTELGFFYVGAVTFKM